MYWDTLTDEEKALLDSADKDSETLLREEIALLSIRERRIMERIRKFTEIDGITKNGLGQAVASMITNEEKRRFESPEEKDRYETMIREKVDDGEQLPGKKYLLTTRTEATYDIINRLEEALTRCQAQKQRCIQNLAALRDKYGAGEEVGNETRAAVEALIRELGQADGS